MVKLIELPEGAWADPRFVTAVVWRKSEVTQIAPGQLQRVPAHVIVCMSPQGMLQLPFKDDTVQDGLSGDQKAERFAREVVERVNEAADPYGVG